MGKDIDLMQAVRDEDLSMLQKLLDRSRSQRSSKYIHPVNFLNYCHTVREIWLNTFILYLTLCVFIQFLTQLS